MLVSENEVRLRNRETIDDTGFLTVTDERYQTPAMKLKNLPIILGFVVLLLTLPAAVFLLSRRQETRVGAELSATALVYLWPQKFTLPRGEGLTLEVKVDTKDQMAKRAEATVSFDPRTLAVSEVQAAPGVTLAQKALDAANGVLQLSGVGDFATNKTLATFKLTGLLLGPTELKIIEAHIWDLSGQVDIFGNAMGAEVTVK